MEYYWELIQFDGTRIEIPPSAVEIVKRRMNDNLPINTKTATIPANQVKTFQITDKVYTDQKLLGEVAQAFNEPVLNEDGSIVCQWVKKNVTQNRWNKYYAPHGYRRLSEDGTMVTIAIKMPLHQINQIETPYCNATEIQQLERD